VPEILRFPKVPELDWLKALADQYKAMEHSDDCAIGIGGGCDCPAETYHEQGEQLSNLHSYIKWSRLYGICHGISREHCVANGFVTKYHRLVFNIEPTSGEVAVIQKSEEALLASNAEIKRRKNAKP
jgi:hypothetical protein